MQGLRAVVALAAASLLGCSVEIQGAGAPAALDAGRPALESGERSVDPEIDAESEPEQPDAEHEPEHPDADGPDASTAHADGGDPLPIRDATVSPMEGGQPAARDGGDSVHDAALPSADAAQPTSCALEGRFASQIDFDVSWVGTRFAGIVPIIAPGQGRLRFVVLSEFIPNAAGAQAIFRTCEVKVPDFIATLPQETYATRFANAVWDSAAMPTYETKLRAPCTTPGCSVKSDLIRVLIGVQLTDPTAAWPASVKAGTWPDHDGDGEPGISAYMLGPSAAGTNSKYDYPPVDLGASERAYALTLAFRVTLSLDGALVSCNEQAGKTLSGNIDSRLLSCATQSRRSACSANEVAFLDDNLPLWTVRQGEFRNLRVKRDADCAEARRVFATP